MKRHIEQYNSIFATNGKQGCLRVALCEVPFTVIPFADGTEWREMSPSTSKATAQRPYLCGKDMIHRSADRLNLGH